MIKTTPMIFNSEMVRALLAGSKTQTRRIVKPQPNLVDQWFGWIVESTQKKNEGCAGWITEQGDKLYAKPPCKSGDLIYVRETFAYQTGDDNEPLNPQVYLYAATDSWDGIRVPSIHMPRRVSRLTLKITSVRVERIQDISEEDAKKEGASFLRDVPDCDETLTEKQLFGFLWDSVYPKSWSKNQWVWVVDFEVIHKNIDQVLAEMERAA